MKAKDLIVGNSYWSIQENDAEEVIYLGLGHSMFNRKEGHLFETNYGPWELFPERLFKTKALAIKSLIKYHQQEILSHQEAIDKLKTQI